MVTRGDVGTLGWKKSVVKSYCSENSPHQGFQSKVYNAVCEISERNKRETEIRSNCSGDKLETTILENTTSISDDDDDDHEYIDFYFVDFSNSPEAVTTELLESLEDDETDRAYLSIESDDGNMPNFDRLIEPQLAVQGTGLLGGKQSEVQYLPNVNNAKSPTLEQYNYLKRWQFKEQFDGEQPACSVKSATVTHSDSTEQTDSETGTSLHNGIQNGSGINEFTDYNYIARRPPPDNGIDAVNELEELTEADVEDVIPIEFSSSGKNERNEEMKSVDLYRSSSIPQTPGELEDEGIAIDLENFESSVGKAYEESVRSDSLGPLIKEELKCVIQCRRLQSGKPEIVLEPAKTKEYKLTDAEVQKKFNRLVQNRKSAWKSRLKSRQIEEYLIKNVEELEDAKEKLVKETKRLRHLKNGVLNRLKQHLNNCQKTDLATYHKRIIELMKV